MTEQNLWGPETESAIQVFPVSRRQMPWHFLGVLIEIKRTAAATNAELGLIDHGRANAIIDAADQLLTGKQLELFPVDVYQVGSGTSSNMNVNEVIATIASRKIARPVLPHEHVNRCQSSNDVVPTAMRIALSLRIDRDLGPAIDKAHKTLLHKAEEFRHVIKVARTHLQDATPIRLGQEFWGWSGQLDPARERLTHAVGELQQVRWAGRPSAPGWAPSSCRFPSSSVIGATGSTFGSSQSTLPLRCAAALDATAWHPRQGLIVDLGLPADADPSLGHDHIDDLSPRARSHPPNGAGYSNRLTRPRGQSYHRRAL